MIETLLLAAGYSTRLYPLTTSIPKPLLPFLDGRLLDSTLGYLAHFGIDRVATNAHHGRLPFLDELSPVHGVTVRPFIEEEILGTGGGILNMRPFVTDDHALIVNCDFVTDVDLRAALDFHVSRNALATLVLVEHPDQRRYGEVGVDGSDRIVSFPREPHRVDAIVRRGLFSGIHFLRRDAFDRMPREKKSFCIVKDVYQPWMLAGESVLGYCTKARWLDVGEKDVFAASQFELLANPMKWMKPLSSSRRWISPRAAVASSARIGDDVLIHPDARVGAATLERCIVFPSASVPDGASLRDCIVTTSETVSIRS